MKMTIIKLTSRLIMDASVCSEKVSTCTSQWWNSYDRFDKILNAEIVEVLLRNKLGSRP